MTERTFEELLPVIREAKQIIETAMHGNADLHKAMATLAVARGIAISYAKEGNRPADWDPPMS